MGVVLSSRRNSGARSRAKRDWRAAGGGRSRNDLNQALDVQHFRGSGLRRGNADRQLEVGQTMERWQQIESLFQQALERDPTERNAWLREACPGDSDLRREVLSLLANHQSGTDSQPWAAAAAAELIDSP